MEITKAKELIGKTEEEVWDGIWEELRKEFELNSCDKCGMIDNSTDLVWITAEDFKPKANEIVPKELYGKYDALCEECYLKLIEV